MLCRIPLCTLKLFPYQIEHTIQWARDHFEGIFVEDPRETSKYYENPTEYLEKTVKEFHKVCSILIQKPVALKQRLESIKRITDVQQQFTYEACVELARNIFQEIFFNQIAQLVHNCPLDSKNQNGTPFWSGEKRAPEPIYFKSGDPKHIEFVQATANIYAHIFGIAQIADLATVAKIADNVVVPEFKPKKIDIKTEEGGEPNSEPVKEAEEDEAAIERL